MLGGDFLRRRIGRDDAMHAYPYRARQAGMLGKQVGPLEQPIIVHHQTPLRATHSSASPEWWRAGNSERVSPSALAVSSICFFQVVLRQVDADCEFGRASSRRHASTSSTMPGSTSQADTFL